MVLSPLTLLAQPLIPEMDLIREQRSATNYVRDARNELKNSINRFERNNLPGADQNVTLARIRLDMALKKIEGHTDRISRVAGSLFDPSRKKGERLMKSYLLIRDAAYELQNEITRFVNNELRPKMGGRCPMYDSYMENRGSIMSGSQDDAQSKLEKALQSVTTGQTPGPTGDPGQAGSGITPPQSGKQALLDELGRLLKEAGLSDEEISKILAQAGKLSEDELKNLVNATRQLSPEERKKLFTELAKKAPAEIERILHGWGQTSPSALPGALRELAKGTPQQIAAALTKQAQQTPGQIAQTMNNLGGGDAGMRNQAAQELGLGGTPSSSGPSSQQGTVVIGGQTRNADEKGKLNGQEKSMGEIAAALAEMSRQFKSRYKSGTQHLTQEEYQNLVEVSPTEWKTEPVTVNWALSIEAEDSGGGNAVFRLVNAEEGGPGFTVREWSLVDSTGNSIAKGSEERFSAKLPSGAFKVTVKGTTKGGNSPFTIQLEGNQ